MQDIKQIERNLQQLREIVKQIDEILDKNELRYKGTLTVDEACHYLGIKKQSMYKLTSQGKIPHYKPKGKDIFFDREELDKWVRRNGKQ